MPPVLLGFPLSHTNVHTTPLHNASILPMEPHSPWHDLGAALSPRYATLCRAVPNPARGCRAIGTGSQTNTPRWRQPPTSTPHNGRA